MISKLLSLVAHLVSTATGLLDEFCRNHSFPELSGILKTEIGHKIYPGLRLKMAKIHEVRARHPKLRYPRLKSTTKFTRDWTPVSEKKTRDNLTVKLWSNPYESKPPCPRFLTRFIVSSLNKIKSQGFVHAQTIEKVNWEALGFFLRVNL